MIAVLVSPNGWVDGEVEMTPGLGGGKSGLPASHLFHGTWCYNFDGFTQRLKKDTVEDLEEVAVYVRYSC